MQNGSDTEVAADGPAVHLICESNASERLFGAAGLHFPLLPTVASVEDSAVFADGPAECGVQEENILKDILSLCLLHHPGFRAIGSFLDEGTLALRAWTNAHPGGPTSVFVKELQRVIHIRVVIADSTHLSALQHLPGAAAVFRGEDGVAFPDSIPDLFVDEVDAFQPVGNLASLEFPVCAVFGGCY